VEEIIEAFKNSKQTEASRKILEALESGKIKLQLDAELTTAGRALSPTEILLRPDMRMQDTLGLLVQEGQHALDMAGGVIPLPKEANALQRLLAEALGWSAELQYLKLNGYTDSATYRLMHIHPMNLLEILGKSYIGSEAMRNLSDASLKSILDRMFHYQSL
jgi:hypothetical protein